MQTLRSHLEGAWVGGKGDTQTLFNPATEEALAETCATGLELDGGLRFAREQGGGALRAMNLGERGKLLGAMAGAIHQHRDELIGLAMANGGNTRGDAKFDIDGASGTLAHYAELAEELGDARYLVDGDAEQIGHSPRMAGRHLWVPRRGVALLINAFNFPAWGFGEKAACALLAGMPVICKPATSSAVVAHRIIELVIDALPAGCVSLVTGSAHELPDLLGDQDVIAFTGSSSTALRLRAIGAVQRGAVRLNVEADSLNGAVLGADVDDDSDTYELFLRDVVREMTQKAGQKCTAIRRILVPRERREQVRDDLVERLSSVVVGNPTADGVRMGPLATAQQQRDVRQGIEQLRAVASVVLGDGDFQPLGVESGKGYFVPVTLLESDDPAGADAVHALEVFGPVATLLGCDTDAETLGELLGRGQGGLVSSIYSDDRKFCAGMLAAAGPYHGRLCFGSRKIAGQAPTPGTVLPGLVHGGPGRAGGGEELGGLRGLALYSQRLAVQGARPMLDAMLGKR